MDKASSFLGKFLACVFTCFFAILFVIFVCFFLFRSLFTYDNTLKYVSDAKVFDSESYEILSSGSSNTLRDSIHKGLLTIGIPELVTDDVLDSDEINEVLTDYIYSYYNYVLYDEQRKSLDESKIVSVIQDKYLISQGRTLNSEQLKDLKHYLNLLTNKLNGGLFSDAEINEVLNLNVIRVIASCLNSNYVFLALVVCLVLMIVLISICLHNLLRAFRWCSKMICLDGVILVITSLLEVKLFSMFFNSKGIVDNLVISVVENGFTGLLTCGVVLVVVGLILIVATGLMLVKKPKSDNVLVQKSSVDDNESKNNYDDEVKSIFDSDSDIKENNVAVKDEIYGQDNIEADGSINDISTEVNSEDVSSEFEEYNTEIVEVSDTDDEDENNDNTDEQIVDTIEMETSLDSSDVDEDVEKETDNSLEETQYTEIFDNDSTEDKIEIKDIKLEPLAEISPDIIYPEKGKDIEVNLDETEEEEIEIL